MNYILLWYIVHKITAIPYFMIWLVQISCIMKTKAPYSRKYNITWILLHWT